MGEYRYLGTPGGSVTFTLADLTAPAYDIYLYSAGDGGTSGLVTFTRGSETRTAQDGHTVADGTFVAGDSGPRNYVFFDNIAPVSGAISIAVSGGDGYAPVNGLQAAAVPEPGSALLLLGGATALAVRQRRAGAR